MTAAFSSLRTLTLPLAAAVLLALVPSAFAARPAVNDELRAADAPRTELSLDQTIAVPNGELYRYSQQVGGVEVLGAEAVLVDPATARPSLVTDTTSGGVPARGSPRVSRQRALEIAQAAVNAKRLRGRRSAELAIAPRHGSALVWRVAIPSERPLGDFEVLVDAATGQVLDAHDALQYATIQAKIFDPNPVAEQGSDRRLRDRHDKDSRRLTALRRARTLPEIEDGPEYCLNGAYVKVLLGRGHKEVCRSFPDWTDVKRSGNSFEALMAYYHIDRTQRYVQGLNLGTDINSFQQIATVDARKGDNSFYSPFTKRITYGSGGVDDAEDADIIVHEYGHSLQDDQAPNFGSSSSYQANSLGEGFGDYLAATMTFQSPGLPAYKRAASCIFDWDGTLWGMRGPCGRTADTDMTFPHAIHGYNCEFDVHCVGKVWSSALLDLRAKMGRRTLERDLFTSQFMYVSYETFPRAVNDLIEADKVLYPADHREHRRKICREMHRQRRVQASSCP